jgi:hypothetical protein
LTDTTDGCGLFTPGFCQLERGGDLWSAPGMANPLPAASQRLPEPQPGALDIARDAVDDHGFGPSGKHSQQVVVQLPQTYLTAGHRGGLGSSRDPAGIQQR